MDPRNFRAPFLRRTQIWERADALRSRFPSGSTLPVPVLDLAEFDLGLELVPKARLKQAGDIEALLLGDLKTIVVDRDCFMDPRAENRLRFSVAHELGHLILHPDVYGRLQHRSIEEWMEFLMAIPDAEYNWLESHAYEFAGRLLVPPEPLREAFQTSIQSAQGLGYSDWLAADKAALDCIASRITPKFGVSDCRQFNYAGGATGISPGLLAQLVAPKSDEGDASYPGFTSHKIILPLLAKRGEGRGEESRR